MPCHLNGVTVNDMPKFLLKNPTVNDHAVIIPSDMDDSLLHISLKPRLAVTSGNARLPLSYSLLPFLRVNVVTQI